MKILGKKILPLFLLAITITSLGFSFATPQAHAQFPNGGPDAVQSQADNYGCNPIAAFTDCLLGGIKFLILGLIYLIGYVGHKILELMAQLYNFAIGLNFKILDNANFIVNAGFKTSLSVVNLGFVLAIILMAFSWILGIESYSGKKMLFKLVTSALLVNFSLLIVGVFLDFSHVIATSFIGGDPATDLVNKFNPQKILETAKGAFANKGDFWGTLIPAANQSIFQALLTWIIAITIGGLGVMVLGRYITLSILIVTMPFVWLFTVLPKYESISKNWWSKFLGQVFFLPAVSFFIYLAVGTYDKIITNGANPAKNTNISDIATAFQSGSLIANQSQYILQTVAFVALLWGGMIAAAKIGEKASEEGIKFAGYLKGKALGYGKSSAKTVGDVGTRPAKATVRGVAGLLSRNRFTRGIANRLSSVGARKNEVEAEQKANFSNLTNEQFSAVLKSPGRFRGPIAKAALMAEAVKRKMVKDMDQGIVEDQARAAINVNPGKSSSDIPEVKAVTELYPSLAGKLMTDFDQSKAIADGKKDAKEKNESFNEADTLRKAQEKAVSKAAESISADKAKYLSEKELENHLVSGNLSEGALKGIIKSGDNKKLEALKKSLLESIEKASPAVKEIKELDTKIRSLKKDIKYANATELDAIKKELKQNEENRAGKFTLLSSKDRKQHQAVKSLHTIEDAIKGINLDIDDAKEAKEEKKEDKEEKKEDKKKTSS